MFLAWVSFARRGSRRPPRETTIPIRGFERRAFAQPRVERLRDGGGPRVAEGAHVVKRHPTADDEDALIAQRRERAPDGEMLLGIEPVLSDS